MKEKDIDLIKEDIKKMYYKIMLSNESNLGLRKEVSEIKNCLKKVFPNYEFK